MSTTILVKKITDKSQQSQQLVTFIASLGITQSLELYSCNDQVYINVDVILPVLSVDIKWFHKNAEMPMHYIIINRTTYINRYGMTKLLGQSKQPAAFKLQDYLYELFYRVETEGFVEKDTLITRKRLFNLNEEVCTYRSIIENNQTAVQEAKNAAAAALNDCSAIENENALLIKQNEQLEYNNKELTNDLDILKTIANKLARYVRVKAKSVPNEAFSDVLGTPLEDIPEEDEYSMIESDAIIAKKTLKKEITRKPINKFIPVTIVNKKHTHYLFRSTKFVDSDQNYKWRLSDVAPDVDFINKSVEYLAGEIYSFPNTELYYRELILSDERRNFIVWFLDFVNGITDESNIETLIS